MANTTLKEGELAAKSSGFTYMQKILLAVGANGYDAAFELLNLPQFFPKESEARELAYQIIQNLADRLKKDKRFIELTAIPAQKDAVQQGMRSLIPNYLSAAIDAMTDQLRHGRKTMAYADAEPPSVLHQIDVEMPRGLRKQFLEAVDRFRSEPSPSTDEIRHAALEEAALECYWIAKSTSNAFAIACGDAICALKSPAPKAGQDE